MKVAVLSNDRKTWALSLARSLALFLRSHGFSVSGHGADATICVGGDGTIFHFFHTGKITGAILGIGSRSSSVCQLRHENLSMEKLLGALLKFRRESRLSLAASVKKKVFRSINDVVVHTHDYRVITISLEINKKSYRFEGDGLVVSTPTGSSAYAYSAGGGILGRNERKIQIVPVCPYRRSLRPITVAGDAEISVSADRPSDFIIDGIYITRIAAGEAISVKKGRDIAFLKV